MAKRHRNNPPKRSIPATPNKADSSPEQEFPSPNLPVELENVLDMVPPGDRESAKRELIGLMLSVSRKTYSGPVPPAEEIEKYEDVIPGLGDRLIQMTENEGKHRREIENTIVRRQFNQSSTAQWMAFILSFFCSL